MCLLASDENFGLHVEDLDFTAEKIRIRRSVWNGEEVAVKTKRGYRIVNIDPSLVEMLRAYLDGRKSGAYFGPAMVRLSPKGTRTMNSSASFCASRREGTKAGKPLDAHNLLHRHITPVGIQLGLP